MDVGRVANIYQNNVKHDIAFVLCNMGVGDMIVTTGLREYLSTIYDSVIALCRPEYVQYLYKFHEGNKKIKHFAYEKKFMTGCCWTFPRELVDKFSEQADIYALGHYSASGIINVYPVSYYEDACIPFEYMKTHVHITPYNDNIDISSVKGVGIEDSTARPNVRGVGIEDSTARPNVRGVIIPKHIMSLYNDFLTQHKSYIVTHQIGSTCDIDLIKKCQINIDDMIVIDINKNLYLPNHSWHDMAQKFINFENPMWYKLLLENATGLCLVDSCIHSLAYLCDLSRVKQKICYYRSHSFPYVDAGFKYIQLCEYYYAPGRVQFSFPDGNNTPNLFWEFMK